MKFKLICTLLVIGLLWGATAFVGTFDVLVAGQAAPLQLAPSNGAYLAAHVGMHVGKWVTWGLSGIAFFVLLGIWWADLVKMGHAIKEEFDPGTGLCLALLLASIMPSKAWSYYSKTNYTEMMVILPNQTAFMVPVAGDNKNSQAQFESADYYNSKKVPTKRVEIPHVQLQGSSWYANYYVPAANLILVNRTPYYREWTGNSSTGTSDKNQSITCESADSIGVTVNIAISAEIDENDAAAYLYRFGVISPFPNTHLQPDQMSDADGAKLFSSVFFAKDLETVMDGVVHGAVKTVLCNEMGSRTLENLFPHKADIIASVQKTVAEMYKPMGITINYVGLASDLHYDDKIQTSIDDVFIARRKNDASVALRDSLDVLQQQANIKIKEGVAEALKTKGLPPITVPSILWIPQGWIDGLTNFFTHWGDTAPGPQVKK